MLLLLLAIGAGGPDSEASALLGVAQKGGRVDWHAERTNSCRRGGLVSLHHHQVGQRQTTSGRWAAYRCAGAGASCCRDNRRRWLRLEPSAGRVMDPVCGQLLRGTDGARGGARLLRVGAQQLVVLGVHSVVAGVGDGVRLT